jgi:hypothetical protein
VRDSVLTDLATGLSLRQIAAKDGMPAPSTVIGWIKEDPVFAERYARAREIGLDLMAEETLAIADNLEEDANSRRVRVDTRKWLLSKLAPKRYGDRLELAGDVNVSLGIAEQIRARREALLAERKQIYPAVE